MEMEEEKAVTDERILIDGTLLAPPSVATWSKSSLFQWINLKWLINFTIQGSGTLDRQGSAWWSLPATPQSTKSHLSEADKQKYSNVIRWMDYIQHKEDFGGSLAKIVVNKPGLEHFNIYVEKTGADLTSKKVSAASKDVAKSDKNINSVKGAAEVLEFKQRSSFFLGV